MATHAHIPIATETLEPETSERLARPFQRFAGLSMSGGIVLLACTILALAWANIPALGDSYHDLFHTYLKLTFGEQIFKLSLVHWINDALMAVFFLLVGLEIKRELLVGELSSVRRAALPAIAAVGGMIVPAGFYAVVNLGEGGAPSGWGVPMATDIAFALGILALLGNRVPNSLRIFLTSLAIVDDLGALLVIAIFYTDQIVWSQLGMAGAVLALLIFFNVIGIRRAIWYVVPGVFLWVFMFNSNVHATIAGVLLAATIPVHNRVNADRYLKSSRAALDVFERSGAQGSSIQTNSAQRAAIYAVNKNGRLALPLLHRMEDYLHSWTAFLIIPIFALANAGVHIGHGAAEALGGQLSLGIMAGLVLGKPVGVFLSCFIACKLGLAQLPKGVTWAHLAGVGCLAGIGFTMALFIANLAFKESVEQLEAAKMGILAASTVSAVAGLGILFFLCPKRPEPEPEELGPKVSSH
ncbi:MAG: Na+/H+ antiporter NhaA [Planctomycetota bacterium]